MCRLRARTILFVLAFALLPNFAAAQPRYDQRESDVFLSGLPTIGYEGRLLPGLLLGLLLAFGAYHFARQMFDRAPGSLGISALLVAGFVFEYVGFGLSEPITGMGRLAFALSVVASSGLAAAGLVFISGFLELPSRGGIVFLITRFLLGAAGLSVALVFLVRTGIAADVANIALIASLLWTLLLAVAYAGAGDLRAQYLLPGLILLVCVVLGAIALSLYEPLSEAILVPILHTGLTVGLALLAFGVANSWGEHAQTQFMLPVENSSARTAEDAAGHRIGASEARLALALAASEHGLWDWNIADERITISEVTEALVGLEAGQFNSSEESWLAIVDEDERESFRRTIAEKVSSRATSFSIVFAIRWPDGTPRRLCLDASCITDEAGNVVRCLGLVALAKESQKLKPVETQAALPLAGAVTHAPHIENDLQRALEREEIALWYQPILALADGRVSGFEVLLRWHHPERGLLMPESFVTLAEEAGLMAALGKYVLANASVQLYQWQIFFPFERPLFASVNISNRQLLRQALVTDMEDVLSAVALAPRSLRIEVPESLMQDDLTLATDILARIKTLGAGIALDHYGKTLFSLAALEKLPLDTIKLDRTFLAARDAKDAQQVLRSLIALAHDRDLDVIAEGIENEAEAARLRALGCEFGQGFYFGSPMPPELAHSFIARNRVN